MAMKAKKTKGRSQDASSAAPVAVARMGDPAFVPTWEAAALLFVSNATIRRWLTMGRLTRYKCGGRTLVDVDEAKRLIVAAK